MVGSKYGQNKQLACICIYIYIYRESQEAGNKQLLEKVPFSMLTKTGLISIIRIQLKFSWSCDSNMVLILRIGVSEAVSLAQPLGFRILRRAVDLVRVQCLHGLGLRGLVCGCSAGE